MRTKANDTQYHFFPFFPVFTGNGLKIFVEIRKKNPQRGGFSTSAPLPHFGVRRCNYPRSVGGKTHNHEQHPRCHDLCGRERLLFIPPELETEAERGGNLATTRFKGRRGSDRCIETIRTGSLKGAVWSRSE